MRIGRNESRGKLMEEVILLIQQQELNSHSTLSYLLQFPFLTCWSLLTEPSRPALEARHSLAPRTPPCPWGSSCGCLRRRKKSKDATDQLLFQLLRSRKQEWHFLLLVCIVLHALPHTIRKAETRDVPFKKRPRNWASYNWPSPS